MEDGRILDSQITASKRFSRNWAAHKGRLNNAAGSWFTLDRGVPEWLQVDLLNKTFIKGVATQGRYNNHHHFVKTYQLLYSDDGTNWTTYKEQGIEKVCFLSFYKLIFRIHRF